MNKIKFRSFKAAFGGIVAALSLLFMLLTSIFPTLTYTMPAIAGALLMALVIEIGSGFAGSVYVAVGILSLLLVADKEAAVMYIAFFGYYPILKAFIESHLKKIPSWIIKFIVFNISMIISYFVVSKVFNIPFDDMGMFGEYALFGLLAMGNVAFLLYDILLTRLVSIYLYRWQKYIKRVFK